MGASVSINYVIVSVFYAIAIIERIPLRRVVRIRRVMLMWMFLL
jgi:hypothetical protein